MTDQSPSSIAPADARPHRAWPLWQKMLAYLLMSILSLVAIWLVDWKVR